MNRIGMRRATAGATRAPLALLAIAALALSSCQREDHSLDATTSPTSALPESELRRSVDDAIRTESEITLSPQHHVITGPTVITASGYYRVANDFEVAAGDGIVVQADYVVLHLGGRTLTGPGNKEGRGVVLDGASHCIVTAGTLARFGIGVVLMNASDNFVRNVSVEGGDEFADPPNGVAPQIGTMLVNSPMNKLGWNSYDLVNLGIFVRGGGSYQNRIRQNTLTGGTYGLLAICYNPAPGGDPAGPHDDDVQRNTINRFGTGIQTSAGSANNRFGFNTIYYFNEAWHDFNGSNLFFRNQTMQITP